MAAPLPPARRRFAAAAVVLAAAALTGCITGARPTLAEGPVDTGDPNVDAVLTRLEAATQGTYTVGYDLLTRFGDRQATVTVVQDGAARRSITVGAIRFIVDGAVRMERLIRDMLAYSVAGSTGLHREAVASDDALAEALASLQAGIADAGAIVTRDPLPVVEADRGQLVQLFQNLVGNAVKFRGERPPRIHVSARRDGEQWLFSVRDNGIGIDPRFADRVFTMFQRVNAREKYDGSGIGLALCKRIVERHGGRISFESQPGRGSTFYFSLPAN